MEDASVRGLTAKARRSRERILEAALVLFAENELAPADGKPEKAA